MSISQRVATALAEAAVSVDPCRACERQGLPILPLRRALVPDTRPGYAGTVAGEPHVETRMGLRTLRSGYLYVLLDQRIWQAYEVTDQGHLRRFNPYEPPPGPPPSLPARCLNENHDIPSSFLTLDSEAYGSAWLAFSSDAWPRSVLDAYKRGHAPAQRFEGLDLVQAREHPQLLGLAMTPDNLQVDKQVFEYAQQLCAPFDSAHGFHSRLLRRTALRGFVVNAMNRHQLEQGVLAVVLDDTVGLVQEYNHQRLSWLVKRQAWREDPLRAYQFQTSQILQIIRATHRQWAAQQVAPFGAPTTGDGAPAFAAPEVERQRLVAVQEQQSDKRLEERYHEPQRAAFQDEYDRQERQFQAYIDQNANAYAERCQSQMFTLIEQYDYDGHDRESGVAYSKTMAGCLAGGVTEAAATSAAHGQPSSGTSEALWLKWLQDPNSPPYRAVLLRNEFLLAALLPSFSASAPINWNDSEKLYAALSKMITSEEGRLHLRHQLNQAVAQTQGALNAASQRLQALLGPGIQQAVRHLNSASQYLYNGVHLVELQVKMKLSEYYALQNAHLRELQNKASATLAKARDRMMPSLEELKAGAQMNARKVQPIIQSGLLSLAVLDPKVAHTLIDVSVWVEGKAEVLREQLLQEVSQNVNQLSHAAQMSLVDIRVAAGTLEPGARKMLEGIRISALQASQMVRRSFSGLKGVAGSGELLLTLGGLYLLSDSLGKNLKKVEEETGAKSTEATLALYGSSAGIIGGAIQALGLVVQKYNPTRVAAGQMIYRAGAIIGVAVGVIDTFQSIQAIRRNALSGDTSANKYHFTAALFSTIGAYAAYLAIYNASLLGPLGYAVALGLTAYSFSKYAINNESTPLELWVKRCHFGTADETPPVHWHSPNDADIAFSELNAATLGISGALKFKTQWTATTTTSKSEGIINPKTRHSLEFRFRLPGFIEHISSYNWILVIHRHGDGNPPRFGGGEILIHEMSYTQAISERMRTLSELNVSTAPNHADYFKDSIAFTRPKRKAEQSQADEENNMTVSGSVTLTTMGVLNITAATLCLTYWPDRDIPSAYAEIELQEINV
ncbi:T6SS effector BTH_I2691 family protein [Pseudomonas sp. WHRI 8519]|uniref:T6SS effector BTH_I2691 family protein n=1 Tax=Pseudomonas sp. WHRI 8519 TaxID=3162567 RepID=UPI0032F092CD